MAKGLLVVISGFSGVGKGTVIQMVLGRAPQSQVFGVVPRRAPRAPGETDGVNYYFLSESEFEERSQRASSWSTRGLSPTTTAPSGAR